MKCLFRHQWEVVQLRVLPSLIEQMTEFNRTREDGKLKFRHFCDPAAHEVVTTYRCRKCGTQKVRKV